MTKPITRRDFMRTSTVAGLTLAGAKSSVLQLGAPMSSPQKLVSTAAELLAACSKAGARHLVVRGNISNAPSIRLAPGQTLAGEGDHASISFVPGADGLQLRNLKEQPAHRLNRAHIQNEEAT